MVDRQAQEIITGLTARNKELEANATFIGFLQFRLQLIAFISSIVQGSKDKDEARAKLKVLSELADEFEVETLEKAIKKRICKNCGAAVSGKFCENCGTPA